MKSLTNTLALASLTVSSSLVVLSTSWPGLGPAWHVSTYWGMLASQPSVRIAFIVLAIAILITSIGCFILDRRLSNVFRWASALPPLAIALLPFETLTLDSLLLRSPLALEAHLSVNSSQFDNAVRALPSPVAKVVAIVASPTWEQNANALSAPEIGPVDQPEDDAAATALLTEIRVLSASLDKRDCLHNAGTDRAPEYLPDPRCVEEQRAFNDPIRERIAEMQAQLARNRQDALANATSSAIAAAAAQKSDDATDVLRNQLNNYGWSLLTVLTVVLVTLAHSLYSQWAWKIPVGVFAITCSAVGVLVFLPQLIPINAPLTPWFFVTANTIAFLSTFLIFRVFRLLVVNNLDLWRLVSASTRRKTFVSAVFLWVPFAIIIGLVEYYSQQLNSSFEKTAYNISLSQTGVVKPDIACGAEPRLIFEIDTCERFLERDIEVSTDVWFEEAQNSAINTIKGSQDRSEIALNLVQKSGLDLFEASVPHRPQQNILGPNQRGLSSAFNYPSDCNWLNVGCRIHRGIGIAIDDSYQRSRSRSQQRIEARLNDLASKGSATGQQVEAILLSEVAEFLSSAQRQTAQISWASFRTTEVLSAVSRLILVMAALKSFGYVLGRTYYSQDDVTEKIAALESKVTGPALTSLRAADENQLTIPPGRLYKHRLGSNVNGVSSKKITVMQPWRQFFSRFPFRHIFQYVELKEGSGKVVATFEAGDKETLFEVELKSGERLCYWPRFLEGFSGNPTLGSRWSFRFSSLMQGRTRIHFAEGPGIVLFKSHQKAQIRPLTEAPDSDINPSRLIAWTDDIDLRIKSDGDFWTVFTGDVVVSAGNGGLAVFDGAQPRKKIPGAIRFVPRLLFPI